MQYCGNWGSPLEGHAEHLRRETPYFLFSTRKLVARFHEFERLFGSSSVYYSLKANAHPELVRILSGAGCSFELSSKYELELLSQLKVLPDRILYGNSIKPSSHIQAFAKYGADRFGCDSEEELEKICTNAPGARVYVRIIVDDSASVFSFSGKFGATAEASISLLSRCASLGLVPYGLSFHVGSQCTKLSTWRRAISNVGHVMEALEGKGIRIEALDLGGGFPCQYLSTEIVPSISEIADVIRASVNDLPYRPQIIVEPGRAMVAEAGQLVASIIGRVKRQNKTWLFLDAGVYNGLFEVMAYQGLTSYPVEVADCRQSESKDVFALAGPTNDSPDVISNEAVLPSDVQVGDRLIFNNIGAYSLAVATEFNGFPCPEAYFE